MALGPVLAAALTNGSARSKTLTVGGVDVILTPGTSANRLGTPTESIRVKVAGPGGVSTMDFVVEDPLLVFTVQDGMVIQFWDVTNDLPIFVGWVDHWSVQNFGGAGATFSISCVGPESLLDWAVIPTDLNVTLTDGSGQTLLSAAIQAAVANAYGRGPLRALRSTGHSTQATPIGNIDFASDGSAPIIVPGGTTLREAIRFLFMSMNAADQVVLMPAVDVDMWFGLRIYTTYASTADASDFMSKTYVDTPTGTPVSDLSYDIEGATVRAVVVHGPTAAASALVADGTGLLGQTAVIDVTTTTASAALAAGVTYLSSYATKVRGSFTDESILASTMKSGGTYVVPGSTVTLTDARVGLSATPYVVGQIEKTYDGGGRENWTFTFGGLPPSGAALLRQFTGPMGQHAT